MRPIDAACVSIWPSEYHAKFNVLETCFKVYKNRLLNHFVTQNHPHDFLKTHFLIEPGDLSISNLAPLDTRMYSAQDNQPTLDLPTIDWIAEAQHSAAEILRRELQNRTPTALALPANVTPWDPHVQRLEATGHGLKLRIIDPCAATLDLGQTVYGPEERLQLGCTLKKKEPRGDLFEALRKP